MRIRRYPGGNAADVDDSVVVEEPLEIRVNGRTLAVTMRTPGADRELAAGFLLADGILRSHDDVWDITRCADPANPLARNIIDVLVAPDRAPQPESGRQRYASSSCGLCGRGSIESVLHNAPPFDHAPPLRQSVLQSLPERLRAAQTVFQTTGGLHAAGIFDHDGTLLWAAEDVGRHNAVDKAVGQALLAGQWPVENAVLLVSGRAGFEIVQKAAAARVPAVCSVSAASSLAVDLARECGMFLAGFLRGSYMTVYAGAERLVPASTAP